VSGKASRDELDARCWPVFQRVYAELGENYKNWLVAIEPESEDYFLGQDDYEVLSRARKRHPKAMFFTYRISEDPSVDRLC
jgi:hypothetical protein